MGDEPGPGPGPGPAWPLGWGLERWSAGGWHLASPQSLRSEPDPPRDELSQP